MGTNTLKIVVANQKGGTGKSTVAINLAIALHASYGGYVSLIDTDTQSLTTSKFNDIRNTVEFDEAYKPLLSIYNKPNSNEIENIINKSQMIVVDTGGFNTITTKAFIATADVVLIPINLSGVEMDTLVDFASTIQKILKATGSAPKLMIVPTRIHHLTNHHALEDYYKPLRELGYIVTPALRQRKIYQDAHALGKGVIELDDVNARTEVYNMTRFVTEKGVFNG